MKDPTISFIIPTIGRESLQKTLSSIGEYWWDQVLTIYDTPPSGKWGNPQRNLGMQKADCDYLAFMDDDDWYVPGARGIMHRAIVENPGKPILFRVQYPNGDILWKEKKRIAGNLTTQMILVPNQPKMLHHWEGGRNMADCLFIQKWKWPEEEIVWHEAIIAQMGHNDKGAKI